MRHICSRCGRKMSDRPALNALSRKDNQTYVCTSCGIDEAMLNEQGKDVWPGFPEQMS